MGGVWTVTVHMTDTAMDIMANCLCLGLVGLVAMIQMLRKGGSRWK